MASRKEQKQALREERLRREQEQAAAARRKRLVGYAVGGAIAAAALVAVAVALLAGGGGGAGGEASAEAYPDGTVPPPQIAELEPAARAAGCTFRSFPSEGADHTEDPNERVRYRSNPPHSGRHFIEPAEDGVFSESPPVERLVHSMEHGRIIVQFRPDVPDSVKGNLNALVQQDPYQMTLVPNTTNMPYEVAATAWSKVLGCPRMNDRVFDAIRAFKERFRSRGPEPVP